MKHHDTTGFTFVEVLTALALLAVLAVIAWGRFSRSYEHALKATMVSDLRNLATAQELYYRLKFTYATNVSDVDVSPSPKSTITITEATPTGWAAWNEMEGTNARCELYVGNASPPLGYAPDSEQIACGTP